MKASSCDRHGVVVCVVPQRPMDSVSPFGGIKETNCLTHILLLLAHTYFQSFVYCLRPCLVAFKIPKFYEIPHHMKCFNARMKY